MIDPPRRVLVPAKRSARLVGLGGSYALLLLWILLWPSGGPATTVATGAWDALLALGLPVGLVTAGRVEFMLNALMIVPATALLGVLWTKWTWERWTAYAFVLSGSVELVQALLLPHRSAQFADVVANTLGALAGAVLAQVAGRRLRR